MILQVALPDCDGTRRAPQVLTVSPNPIRSIVKKDVIILRRGYSMFCERNPPLALGKHIQPDHGLIAWMLAVSQGRYMMKSLLESGIALHTHTEQSILMARTIC